MMLRRALHPMAALLVAAVAASCGQGGVQPWEFQGLTMGTTYSVQVVTERMPADRRAAVESAIVEELELVNRLMSHYMEDSEVSRFNRSDSLEPFPVAPETAEVFAEALAIGAETAGALDVTVGPLVDAWGFGPPGQQASPPDEDDLARLLAASGNRHLHVAKDPPTLRKDVPGLRCDLSSIAKGYAVDRIADALEMLGLARYLVEVGGEVRVRGASGTGDPWRVAVERPDAHGRAIQRVVALTEGGVATSGDYRNWYEVDGERVSHILDPRSGRPIRHRLASVTVIAERCSRADGLATALTVLGPDEGFRVAGELGIAAYFLARTADGTFEEQMTSRFIEIAGDGR